MRLAFKQVAVFSTEFFRHVNTDWRHIIAHRHRIGFIGAGNIGGTAALLACVEKLGSIVLFDINQGVAKGKALDIAQSLPIQNISSTVIGTANPKDLAGCSVVIVTAGIPRKAGMSRDDLLDINAKIMKSCAIMVRENCPDAFCIIITNPLDAMVWAFAKISGLPAHMVIGMAGILDTARYRYFLSLALKCDPCQIQTLVLGGHADAMLPLPSHTTVAGIPLQHYIDTQMITWPEHDKIVNRTRMGGGEIVGLLENGSAYHAPAAAALQMARSYLFDERKCLPCAVYQDEILGVRDIYAGLSVVISGNGARDVIIPTLTADEEEQLRTSLKGVENLIQQIKPHVY
ncbi:MAG: malate dehydrogenase [Alphaproteobacteria bacterium]|nr:MAG: malate dehydrogenase [Alphaproteobacteria bacterium]